MIPRFRLFAMLMVVLVCRGTAQTGSQTAMSGTDSRVLGNLEVLSDTRGVNFGPYLSRVVQAVRTNWYHLIPDEARAPYLKKGKVSIEFAILPDGRVADMKLTEESGDVSLDRAAWGGITASAPLQPLPSEFHGPYTLLRFHFYYNPTSADSHDSRALFANASSAAERNDCGSAIPLAIRVTEMYPQHTAAWNLLGLCYLQLDELQKAEDALQRQIQVSPQSTFAYNNLGRVYVRQRKFDMAIGQFRKQIEINPRDRYAHMNLAASLRSERKCDQAIPEYQLAVELTPENAGPHVGLARCYLDQGKQDSGVAEIDKAAALTSTGPGWNELAWTMAQPKIQLDRAEQYARLAVSMDSSSLTAVSLDPLTPGAYARTRALAVAWDTLGWILFLRGDFASAEKYILASWMLSPSPTVSDHLVQVSEKLGRKDDALKYSTVAVAEGEIPSEEQDSDGNAVANSRERLLRLASSSAASNQISQDVQSWLEQQNSFAVPNPAKYTGSAEFALLRIQGQSLAKARWIDGDPALKDFQSEVAARMPAGPADVGVIDVLRWGSLSCEKPDAECNFRLASAREAVYAQLRSTVKPETAATDTSGVATGPALSSRAASTSANAQQVEVAPGISQGLLLYKVQPTYPPLARQALVQGTVVLHALIGKDGTVQDLSVISGHPMLIQAAMDAVKQWRYKPYLRNGEPVLVETTINVNFALSGAPSEGQGDESAANSSSSESGSSNPPQGEESDLKAYTSCDLGPEFQIAQVDGPVKDFAWPTPTKNGEVRISVETGFRVLVTYKEAELFGNLKVERLPKAQYLNEKADILSSLEYFSEGPGNEPKVQTDIRNGLTVYGSTRNKLEGGTLGVYELFLDDESVVVSMYLLNAKPAERQFSTLHEYKKIRDKFLDAYTACVASAQKSAPAEAGTSQTLTHEAPANGSASNSGSSNPPKAPQAVQSATSNPSQQGYIIERSATKLVYDADGTGSREIAVAMRIQSQAGVQDLAVLTFRYTSYNEIVDIEYVRVKKPDGTVVVTPEANTQDMTAEVTRLAPMYSDVREKHVTVKALGAGDVLEYAVRYRTIRLQVRGQFWYQYSFFRYKIANDEELEISVPRDKYVKVKSPDYPPQIKDDGARRIYTWKTSNLIAKDREESLNTQESPPPSVQLTTFRDWAEVGSWYEELQRPQMAVTPQIQAKVAQLTKGLTSDDDRIRALYDYVSTRFHYVSLSFGIGRYQPHASEEVLENEYGDCKDKHTLLATLLKAAGYDAWPALMNSSRKIDPDVPSPGQFDHVITVVPRSNSLIWLDTTPGVAPFGLLGPSLRDKQALVIPTGKPASLMMTPANPPFPSVQTFMADGKVTPEGTFTAHMQSNTRGDAELTNRFLFRQYPAAQWKDLVQQFSYLWGFAGNVSDVTASNPEDTTKPFEFTYDYKREKFGDWDNHRITLPLPPSEVEYASLEKKKPEEPVSLGALGTVVYKARIELPRGSTPQVPDKVDLNEDFADFHASYAFKDGALSATRELTIKKNNVPSVEWDAYKRFSKAVMDDHDRWIDLEVGTTSVPSASSNPEAARLFQESYTALQNHDLTRAEEDLNHLLQLDPTYPYAHANLGAVYLDEGNVEGGIRELRKEEELNPNESYSYRMLARALLYKHENPEAIAQLQKLLLLDPKDRDAALSLGQLLSAEKRYPEAVTVLQRASEQAPDSATLQYQLGYAYLNNGEKDKGLAVLQKALSAETDSSRSSNEMNSVAYTLIEMHTGLDLAKQYALKALAEQEAASLKAGTGHAGLSNTSALGATWDTVGWLYYHLGKYDEALSYLRASWILAQHVEVGDHLGQLYAKLGEKQEAAHVYRLAFASARPSTRGPGSAAVLQSVTEHYKALMGKDANPGAFTTTRRADGTFTPMPSEELSRMRMVKITTASHPSSHGTVSIVFSPGKVEEVTLVDGDETLKSMLERILAAKFNVEFPDQTPARLVRRGIIYCGSLGCDLTLVQPDDRSLLAVE